jgi:multiple sugar transport system permease protein
MQNKTNSNPSGGYRLLNWTGAIVLFLFVVGPILWAISTALKTEVKAVTYPPEFLPDPVTISNFYDVFTHQTFLADLYNSFLYAIGAVIVALIVSVPAGYAAARFEFRGKRALMLAILATSMIPNVALLVPTYYLLDQVGLLNSQLVIIIISASRLVPQSVWFMQNFVSAVPHEIDEAALIDGANRRTILFKLILPLIKPGLAATAVLGIITTWNDYITVAVFAPDIAMRTLQVALVNQVFDSVGISWSYAMAFAIVSSIPMVAIFIVAQRSFVAGLTAGTVKG